ncbi:fumarylacetoacetate hydrolase family protein [Aeromicrobium sp. CF4.19]|uniref:fumarylacetoacetate hydrolase family protein n=1 Tax=Aeromicrobium sp. CF4.19 TaxID=3373082 RepID=UPI003EE7B4FA
MKLVTFRVPGGHRAGRLDGDVVTEIDATDVGQLLSREDWQEVAAVASGPQHSLADLDLAPVVPEPSKVICVGLNYRQHILEMGRDLPEHPTLFAKFADSLIGPADTIVLPPEDDAIDWEAELVIVIGTSCRRASAGEAEAAIAGYTVANDVSMRTWQFRTREWLQGKAWEASTPVGPAVVTPDEWSPGPTIRTVLNDETMQEAPTGDLVHGPVDLVRYVSTMTTLRPGDLILTGTPGGVGHARTPSRYLVDGDHLVTAIDGLGELSNPVVAETVD